MRGLWVARRLNGMASDEAVNWSRRYKANLEKLGSGDLARVAEVISDLEIRDRDRGLSAGEMRMLSKARHMRRQLNDGRDQTQ
jgi:CarD family transcriptional regulator